MLYEEQKQSKVSYKDYIQYFEELDTIRETWFTWINNVKIAYNSSTFCRTPNLPTYPGIGRGEYAIDYYYSLVSTSLTSPKVFGDDYKQKVQTIRNASIAIIKVMNDGDNAEFYIGLPKSKSIYLPKGENYDIFITSTGCECLGVGLLNKNLSNNTIDIDAIWTDSDESTKAYYCKTKWVDKYEWYRASSLSHGKLLCGSIIDLLSNFPKNNSVVHAANPVTEEQANQEGDKTSKVGAANNSNINYNFNVDYELNANYDISQSPKKLLDVVNPLSMLQYKFGVSYDIGTDLTGIDCNTGSTGCFSNPAILIDTKQEKVLAVGMEVGESFRITISPKLKHWRWARRICAFICKVIIPLYCKSKNAYTVFDSKAGITYNTACYADQLCSCDNDPTEDGGCLYVRYELDTDEDGNPIYVYDENHDGGDCAPNTCKPFTKNEEVDALENLLIDDSGFTIEFTSNVETPTINGTDTFTLQNSYCDYNKCDLEGTTCKETYKETGCTEYYAPLRTYTVPILQLPANQAELIMLNDVLDADDGHWIDRLCVNSALKIIKNALFYNDDFLDTPNTCLDTNNEFELPPPSVFACSYFLGNENSLIDGIGLRFYDSSTTTLPGFRLGSNNGQIYNACNPKMRGNIIRQDPSTYDNYAYSADCNSYTQLRLPFLENEPMYFLK